ncbi:MAG: beta-ketoacyl-[acyl-carrier-protein] synthase family protein [Nitrospirae bacterium]|nr:beta-ketoacyl-[acyl-carrier-protein] synthase family protein [Nitrospirota bacterium]
MSERVVITGLGVISSIGIGWEQFWNNLLKGQSGISPVASFDTSNQFTHMAGEVKIFKPENFMRQELLGTLSRSSQMALAGAKLALNDAHILSSDASTINIATCIGTNIGSIQTVEKVNEILLRGNNIDISDRLVAQIPTETTPAMIAKEFNLDGGNMIFSTACSAGNYAVGYGFDLIKLDRAQAVLAGGFDAFSKVAFTGFNQFAAVAPDKCRPFDKNRKGMMVAEGAGMLVLEALESALQRKALIYAEVLGYGLSCDAHHMTSSSVDGIKLCMRKALKEAGVSSENIDYISAHGTGTLTNDKNECAAIKEVFGRRCNKIPASSIKSMLGHTMGAASAIEAITCALVVKNDMIPPTINYETPDSECDIDCVPNQSRKHSVTIALNNSYAFGGNNACLVLSKFIN